jgi:hypothetical protein
MSIHDFWSGRTSIPPGLSPALPRHSAAVAQCIPQRNRLTGAYQPPAAVWMEPQPIVAQPIEQAPAAPHAATVGTVERFEWLELRG